MKTTFLATAILFGIGGFAQESTPFEIENKTAIFTLNPSNTIKNTMGINAGILDSYEKQTINGINLQANPFSLLYPLLPKAIPVPTESESTVTINGIHLSTGGLTDGKKLNGVGISIYHHARITNGFSANFFNNTSGELNGLHVSGFYNEAETGNGMVVAFANDVADFNGVQVGVFNTTELGKGLQIGFLNKTKKQKGIQVGVINKSDNRKGLQIGFWNKNAKRTLPLLNF